MASISLATLSQNLEKRFKVMGVELVHKHAQKYLIKAQERVNSWVNYVRKQLSTPASKRGRIPNRKSLNPHDSLSYNNGIPMMVSGKLRDSIYAKASLSLTSDGARIRITRAIGTNVDYAYILNKGGKNGSNMVLKNYMERMYEKLDERLYSLAKHQGGF